MLISLSVAVFFSNLLTPFSLEEEQTQGAVAVWEKNRRDAGGCCARGIKTNAYGR
jgi:hypothetical protein